VGGPKLAVHRREELPRGARCEGPCAIEEFSGTTFVPRGHTGVVTAEGLRIATS
jgi:N-methylhydantoinase A/oxoprolinase/acetone carboxylase beta subunit